MVIRIYIMRFIKFLIIFSFLFVTVLSSWAQGQIIRLGKNDPSIKKTEKPKVNSKKSNTVLSETVNGILVHWNGATQNQKVAITHLLNDMIEVRGGSFMMENDKSMQRETVNSFKISRYEVTQKLWKAVMGKNPSSFKGDNNPVENVSWKDCQAFITKLNRLTGLNFRLPKEAEWEFAARGGVESKDCIYSGSNDANDVAWFKNNSDDKTHPVGTKAPNELGLYDMTGNVWEWTLDKVYVPGSPYDTFYRIKGGDYLNTSEYLDPRRKASFYQQYGQDTLGFRLVL